MDERASLVPVRDTRLWVVERGDAASYPLILLHGGPGLDHHVFGDYLDPLTDRLRLILADQRAQGRSDRSPEETWTLPHLAADVVALADSLGLERYAVLGHSYGAFVALQNAVDFPGAAAQTIVSSGIPSTKFLAQVHENLDRFEPEALRRQVQASWDREATVRTAEECAQLARDQMPFHFADPLDPRIEEFLDRTAATVHSPGVLRHAANDQYGGIDIEDLLHEVTQPVLVLAGRHDRACSVEAAEAIADGIARSELVVFEHSGHMTFVEENEAYLAAVRGFLEQNAA